uniref:Uncharacterized protein n=1 Tax=Romanomermis culicivorax TaxID=13658 RepID=A0A915J976_ROMCU
MRDIARRGVKFGVTFDDLVHGFGEVLLRGGLAPLPDGVHARFGADAACTRPGLIKAGSNVSGRFVAIMTLMLPRESKPSN